MLGHAISWDIKLWYYDIICSNKSRYGLSYSMVIYSMFLDYIISYNIIWYDII